MPPPEGIVLEQVSARAARRWIGVDFIMLMTMGLDDMVQWRFGDGHVQGSGAT
jgi:hypothetical protein